MKWIKKGLIYGPPGNSRWAQRWALQPTPWLRDNGTIRIFCGFRTLDGVSRVGYVDVNADNPSEVLGVSPEPVLDIGIPGAFDHPRFLAAIERVVAVCRQYGVAPGIMQNDVTSVRQWMARGFRAIAYSGDLWLLQGALRDGLRELREGLPPSA